MNFKKHISLLLAFFLLVSNLGMAIDVHYCGDKIASIQPVLWKTSDEPSFSEKACCLPEKSNNLKEESSCCKDKLIQLDKKTENVVLKSFSFSLDSFYVLEEWKPVIFSNASFVENNNLISYCCDANAPPLFQLYHQYIFYA